MKNALFHINQQFEVVLADSAPAAVLQGTTTLGETDEKPGTLPVIAVVPACPVKNLGDPSFCNDYKLRYPYIGGSMAHGISSAEMAEALGNAGMLGFYGAAGMPVRVIEQVIDRLKKSLENKPYGFNLIHSPNEPRLEAAAADLYIRRGVRLVEASAFLGLTLPLVRYRVHGIHTDNEGRIVTPNRIIAKVSRVEVASRFFAPPPENFLKELVANGDITQEQASLAATVPMAQDVTAEADSGGHTDNRPAIALLPTLLALRDRMQAQYGYRENLRVGLGGGISTPAAAAAAFSMGAAYIVVGSAHQACIEAGTSDVVRELLAQAQQADVTMAPAADMFEMGVKVQVLKRGTMFPMRSAKLAELYKTYDSIETIPDSERVQLEKNIFRTTINDVWQQTIRFFQERDTTQLETAEKNPKHKMALIFRWYLGQTSHWAIAGEPSRKMDYQIWCGPAMGAFNEWTKGTFLENNANRRVVTVALNLLHGAAVISRLNIMRFQGVNLLQGFTPAPLTEAELTEYMK